MALENIPDIPEKVAEKLPTVDQWRKYGSYAVTYVFMILFVLYFLYQQFLNKDQCSEKIAAFEQVIIQKDRMIEQLNQRVSKLENFIDVQNGVIKKVEETVSSDMPQAGGSR